MGGAGSAPGHGTQTGGGAHGRVLVRLGLASLVLVLLSCTFATGEQEQEGVTESEEPECWGEDTIDCASELLPGQYLCTSLDIDTDTQQLRGCRQSNGTGKVGDADNYCY
jgi:hypothetical protein